MRPTVEHRTQLSGKRTLHLPLRPRLEKSIRQSALRPCESPLMALLQEMERSMFREDHLTRLKQYD